MHSLHPQVFTGRAVTAMTMSAVVKNPQSNWIVPRRQVFTMSLPGRDGAVGSGMTDDAGSISTANL